MLCVVCVVCALSAVLQQRGAHTHSHTDLGTSPPTPPHPPTPTVQVRAPRVEEVSSVEASLRLDAVASAGFRMSRGKMTDLIKSGDVRVNWRAGCKASSEVKPGASLLL